MIERVEGLRQAKRPGIIAGSGIRMAGAVEAFNQLIEAAGVPVMPTWLAIVSYLLALFLLISTTLHPVVVLLFPIWVVVAGLVVFLRAGRVAEPAESERQSA